jgi:iron complex transport system permease protein
MSSEQSSQTPFSARASKSDLGRIGREVLIDVLLIAAPFLCMFVSLFCGRYPLSISNVVGALLPFTGIVVPPEAQALVVQVRLPRTLAAAAVGAALAASGAAFQGVFRNPLVNPGLLGVSSGASFGAALAIVVAGGGMAIYPSAFAFGILAVSLSYWIARVYRQTPTIMLILGGVIVSSVFSSLVSLMKYVADPDTQLPSIVYWLLGSLSGAGFNQFWALIPIALGVAVLLLFSWRIDVLSMGDKEARSLGIDVGFNKTMIISGATLATAGAVCLAGVVGWVGLVIPHIGRMLVGSGNRRLIPASLSIGAAFLVVVDTIARCFWASEVPLGILTSLIGAPFFVYLLKRTKGGTWR